jgi:hypothetical protein
MAGSGPGGSIRLPSCHGSCAQKSDGIDFVGNSKISSFWQNPPLIRYQPLLAGIFIPSQRANGRGSSYMVMAGLQDLFRPSR